MPSTPHIPRELRLLPFRGSLAVNGGLITRARLRRSGWLRLFPDVYIAADVPLDYRLWCEAAIVYLGGPGSGAALSGRTAARLYGVPVHTPALGERLAEAPSGVGVALASTVSIEVTVQPQRRVRRAEPSILHIFRSRLSNADVFITSGLPLTTPARTAFDISRRLRRNDAVATVDAMLNKRIITLDEVRDYLLSSPPLPGRPRVPHVLKLCDPLAQSPMESYLRLVLVDDGLPRPAAQVAVHDANGRLIGYVDLGYREERVGIEYEGDHHRDRLTFRRDIARINAMQEAGWAIIRATARDVRDPTNLLRQVRALLKTRAVVRRKFAPSGQGS